MLLKRLKYREDSVKQLQASALEKDKDIFTKISHKEQFINQSKRFLNDINVSQELGDINKSQGSTFESPRRGRNKRGWYAKNGKARSEAVSANKPNNSGRKASHDVRLTKPTGIGYAAVRQEMKNLLTPDRLTIDEKNSEYRSHKSIPRLKES